MKRPEQLNTEYKTASKGRIPKDIWQSIVAFANTDGGTIYFGVGDNDGRLTGLSAREADKVQRDVASLCNNGELSTKLYPEIRVLDNNIVVIRIEPAQAIQRPVYRVKNGITDGTYIRIGSTNQKADGDIIRRFSVAARGGAECLWYDEPYLDVLDLEKIKKYINIVNQNSNNVYQDFTTEDILIKLRVISKGQKQVSLFGLLAFSKDQSLQEIVAPTINVAVTKFPGLSKVDESNLARTYESSIEFNGSVSEQFSKALAYIKMVIPTKSVIEDNGIRVDKLAIPEVAIREALANAIAHRDYSTNVSKIQIDIFNNRIEITNPGTSLVPIENIDNEPSMTRNPLLMNYLKELGIVDQKGRGIRTIICALKEEDLIQPRFENLAGKSFRATLYSTAILTQEDKEFLSSVPGIERTNKNQKNAIVYAKYSDNGINNGEYREINNMRTVRDDKRANKELNQLVELGIFKPVGDKKWRRYYLAIDLV